ncbi:hypothetical protein BGP_1823 [Beggiatoa sp. PS]|nr:hypothetical protein BGP_1823 [Beggiatoa sp. PS]
MGVNNDSSNVKIYREIHQLTLKFRFSPKQSFALDSKKSQGFALDSKKSKASLWTPKKKPIE